MSRVPPYSADPDRREALEHLSSEAHTLPDYVFDREELAADDKDASQDEIVSQINDKAGNEDEHRPDVVGADATTEHEPFTGTTGDELLDRILRLVGRKEFASIIREALEQNPDQGNTTTEEDEEREKEERKSN